MEEDHLSRHRVWFILGYFKSSPNTSRGAKTSSGLVALLQWTWAALETTDEITQ